MLSQRGSKAVKSVPAETELAAMLVPSCARAKDVAMKKTPKRSPELPSSMNLSRRSRGFQMASSYRTEEAEETMMPMNEVMAKPKGIVIIWDQSASLGFCANREKSLALTMSVAKLEIEDIMPLTISQAKSLPWTLLPAFTMGPIPTAREIVQARKVIPATGTTYALTVKRCRTLWTGNQSAGSDTSQKMKKEAKCAVSVPEFSLKVLGTLAHDFQIVRIMR